MQVTKVLGVAAVGALLVLAAPAERANALSLSNPGAAAAVQQDTKQATTEVTLATSTAGTVIITGIAGIIITIAVTGAAGESATI